MSCQALFGAMAKRIRAKQDGRRSHERDQQAEGREARAGGLGGKLGL